MTTLSSPSSSFLSPLKPLKPLNFCSRATKSSLHPKKLLSLNSLHSPEPDPSVPPAVRTFWKWITDEGVVSPKSPFKPAIFREGLGLVALRDIAEDEVILKVPRRLWISPHTVSLSEIGTLCADLKPWASLSLFLIREKMKRAGSRWRCYIDILPKYTDSTIFWSEEELSQIQGTQLLRATLDMKKYLETEFRKVEQEIIIPHKDMFPFPITLDDFFWGFGMVRSRAFASLHSKKPVLLPVIDLINHSSTVTREECASEIEGPAGLFSWDLLFALQSPIPVKAGEQILIQYNLTKSNADLALDYGFIESTRERNVYILTLEISKSDPYYEDKLAIAKSNGLGETASFSIFLDRPLPQALLPYLRLIALAGTDTFLLEPLFRDSIWGHLELPVSRANEELICQMARNACRSALSSYHTTIEEDEELMNRVENLEPRLAIAVGIRAGEKKVLQQIDGYFRDRELKLNELEYYQERRLKELGVVSEQGQVLVCEPK